LIASYRIVVPLIWWSGFRLGAEAELATIILFSSLPRVRFAQCLPLCRSASKISGMNLDPLLSSLPKEVAPILNKFAGKAVEFRASASHNTANNNAVQVCGPVAGSIQYMYVYIIRPSILSPLSTWTPAY